MFERVIRAISGGNATLPERCVVCGEALTAVAVRCECGALLCSPACEDSHQERAGLKALALAGEEGLGGEDDGLAGMLDNDSIGG